MVASGGAGPGQADSQWRQEFVLLDGRPERAAIDRVLDAVRNGLSGILVLRGGPGTGKTTFLKYAASAATDLRVCGIAGVESKISTAFDGLHRLLIPFLPLAEQLPPPQRDALRVAFGQEAGPPPERFLVGLAALAVLSRAAEEQALLCVIDDAHWLDPESVQVLDLIARRLRADRVGIVAAVDEHIAHHVFEQLPTVTVDGLSDAEARELFLARDLAGAGRRWSADASLTSSLLEHAPVAVALWDTSLRCVWLNSVAAEHAGIAVNADVATPFKEAARNFRLHEVEPMMRRVLENGKPVIDYRLDRVPGADGEACTFSVSMFRVDKADGSPLGVGTIGFDISDSKAHQRLSLLNTAAKRIGTTLDVVTTAQELADIAVASFADYVTVDLADTVPFGTEPRERPGSADYGEPRFRRAGLASIHPGVPEAVFARGETVFLPPSSPIARPVMTGISYFEPYLNLSHAWLNADPARATAVRKANMHSAMIVPLQARGTILGVAVFARTDNPAPFTSDDLLLAEELVARASLNLDDARQYARERTIALALQRDLLPRHLSGGRAVDVASTYLPTDQHAGAGGDWYDVIPLPEGRVALVVGDVVGHGIGAAATMGRMRTAVHTLAALGLAPHEVIARLDSLAPHLSSAGDSQDDQGMTGLIATCIYARYDPVTRICSFARAGHPPPAILAPDGKVTFPDVPTGGPIGLGLGQYASLDVQLAEGSVIAMFTDGLIETRADGIDTGLDRLGAVLAGATGELDDICADVIDRMWCERPHNDDDVALLLARTRAAGPARAR